MKIIRVNLDTRSQLETFVKLCEKQDFDVFLTDGSKEFRVSAKSTLGCILAQIEWNEIYCEYDEKYGNGLEQELAHSKLLLY